MTILSQAIEALRNVGIDSAQLDAELLLSQAVGLSRIQLKTLKNPEPSPEQATIFKEMLTRRLKREPIAYILGEKEFWSLNFKVSPAVLCPRPDTEILVEAAIATRPQKVLDLGTGSGAILLSILHDCPEATGIGVDISPQALEIAQENAQHLGLASRARFLLGSWCEGLQDQRPLFDLIVSNPPYIATQEVPLLEPEVAVYEPKMALDGGSDGLDPYRALIPQVCLHLKESGWIMLEVGLAQAPAVAQLLSEHGLHQITLKKDYQGIERCVIAQR